LRPLLDTSYADYLRAWEARGSVTSPLASGVVPAPNPSSSEPEKVTSEQLAEYNQIVRGYYRSMVPPENLLAEIKKKDWPERLKVRARKMIAGGWRDATEPFVPRQTTSRDHSQSA